MPDNSDDGPPSCAFSRTGLGGRGTDASRGGTRRPGAQYIAMTQQSTRQVALSILRAGGKRTCANGHGLFVVRVFTYIHMRAALR